MGIRSADRSSGSSAIRTTFQAIRGFFAVQPDPHAGGDLGNAQRLGAVLWGLALTLVILLLPVSPPDEAIGDAGWAVAGVLLFANLALVATLRRERLPGWGSLLAVSYSAVVGISGLQWLAGGVDAPYERLLLLPVLFAAALQSRRTTAVFLGVVGLSLAAPFLYGGWSAEAAGSDAAALVVWSALAVMVNLLMTGVRAQRLAFAAEEAEARSEARHDVLTGLHNRRAFDEALEMEVTRARRLQLPLSVGMVDVEAFKEINDRWGHTEGDRCLREVGDAIRAALRRPDLCFRWGGDEFAVILSGTPTGDTHELGERLSEAIAENCERPDGEPIRARFAAAELHESQDAAELAERAGLALTEAKAHTRR